MGPFVPTGDIAGNTGIERGQLVPSVRIACGPWVLLQYSDRLLLRVRATGACVEIVDSSNGWFNTLLPAVGGRTWYSGGGHQPEGDISTAALDEATEAEERVIAHPCRVTWENWDLDLNPSVAVVLTNHDDHGDAVLRLLCGKNVSAVFKPLRSDN